MITAMNRLLELVWIDRTKYANPCRDDFRIKIFFRSICNNINIRLIVLRHLDDQSTVCTVNATHLTDAESDTNKVHDMMLSREMANLAQHTYTYTHSDRDITETLINNLWNSSSRVIDPNFVSYEFLFFHQFSFGIFSKVLNRLLDDYDYEDDTTLGKHINFLLVILLIQ